MLITLTFETTLPVPLHSIGARVAQIADCSPAEWMIGTVTGLYVSRGHHWMFVVVFDYPSGFTEDCSEQDLVSVAAIPILQNTWEVEEREAA